MARFPSTSNRFQVLAGLICQLLFLQVLGRLEAVSAVEPAAVNLRLIDIVARDGTILKGNLVSPKPAPSDKTPAIVFINSWGLNDVEYIAQATKLANTGGYTVLSYTTRGFWLSGGAIDTAGPLDIADASTVLDWLVNNTNADPEKIGFSGVSYGAGISLIASAVDSRIKAVCALSGWADLAEAFYGYQTRRPQVSLLRDIAKIVGKPSDELNSIMDSYFNRPGEIDRVLRYAEPRSAVNYLDQINANKPAILLANAYEDSLFPPNQLISFYRRLSIPYKRIEFAPGDHVIPELLGLAGLPNHVWVSVRKWFDRFLAGKANGVENEGEVQLRRIGTGGLITKEEDPDVFKNWDDLKAKTGAPNNYYATDSCFLGTCALSTDVSNDAWEKKITTGRDTAASAGVALLSGAITGLIGLPPQVWLGQIDRRFGAVWLAAHSFSRSEFRGIASMELNARVDAGVGGTIVAYLYDVDAFTDHSTLITFSGYTWKAQASSSLLPLKFEFPAVSYDIPFGHRLGLVIDTKDGLVIDENAGNGKITLVGPLKVGLPLL